MPTGLLSAKSAQSSSPLRLLRLVYLLLAGGAVAFLPLVVMDEGNFYGLVEIGIGLAMLLIALLRVHFGSVGTPQIASRECKLTAQTSMRSGNDPLAEEKASPPMTTEQIEILERLTKLKSQGALTAGEFERQKQAILGPPSSGQRMDSFDNSTQTSQPLRENPDEAWSSFVYNGLIFLSFIIPIAGVVIFAIGLPKERRRWQGVVCLVWGVIGAAFWWFIVINFLWPKVLHYPRPFPAYGASINSVPVVTKEKYDRIREGMSYSLVVDIIGAPGEEMSRTSIGGYETVMYLWKNRDGANMNAMFQNDKLVIKSQFELP